MKIIRSLLASLIPLVISAALLADRASAQQVQCASQYGSGNIASQIQNSIFGAGTSTVVPLYQNQCFGQVGAGNSAAQLQVLGALTLPTGNYNLPTTPGGQGLLQLGDNNFALQQNLNLILPPGGAGLNISNSEANPTIINTNNNYNTVLGR